MDRLSHGGPTIGLAVSALLLTSTALASPVLQGPPSRTLTNPASIVSPAKPDARPAPIADLYAARSLTDASWSADGRWVVLGTNLSGRVNLWRMPADGGAPVQLTVSDDRNYDVAVTPSGQVIYQADLAGAEIYDLWAAPLMGGAPVNLTATPDISETNPIVSPDGKLLAFERRAKSSPSTDIAVLDLATRQVRVLTHEQAADRSWSLAGFSGDSRTVIANRGDFQDKVSTVWSIDAASGQAKSLTPETALVAAAAVSRSGEQVAVTYETGGVRQAGLLDVATGKIKSLKPDAWEQGAADFTPDGGSVIFGSNIDGRETLFIYDMAKGVSRALPLPPGISNPASDSHESFSPDGSKLLVNHQSGSDSPELWLVDLKTWKAHPLTRLGLTSLSGLPESQIVHYKSADGTVISAFLWAPFNLKRDGRAPGVVLPHGGPTGQTVDSFNRIALAFASRGYVALAPNPRGSTGYGKAFEDANRKDLGGGDLEDEVAGAKFLAATGYVDPKRIGITGGSYGGYMTLMAVSKTPNVWAAGAEWFGIIDWAHMYATEAPPLQSYQRGLIGDPVKDAAVYKASSPMTYMHQTAAPLLVLQGDNDIRVPKSQAEEVVATLKADGRIVDAHFYPNEGHGFVKRENQVDALERTIDWFDKYLKGPFDRP